LAKVPGVKKKKARGVVLTKKGLTMGGRRVGGRGEGGGEVSQGLGVDRGNELETKWEYNTFNPSKV